MLMERISYDHDTAAFSCGVDIVDEALQKEGRRFKKSRAMVWPDANRPEKIVGWSSASLQHMTVLGTLKEQVVFLEWIARDLNYPRVGPELMLRTLADLHHRGRLLPAESILLEPLVCGDPDAMRRRQRLFAEEFGFELLPAKRGGQPHLMHLPITLDLLHGLEQWSAKAPS